MDLKSRLLALQVASGSRRVLDRAPGAAAPAGRAAAGGDAVPAQAPPAAGEAWRDCGSASEHALAAALGARLAAPGVLYRRLDLPLGYRHGGQALAQVLAIGSEPLGVQVPPPERGWLFLDTETTGLAGGTGTLVFLFGGVQVDGHGFRLHQWLLTRFAGELPLLTAVQDMLDQSALIVSYNGKSFDLPLLRTRQRLHGRQLRERHLTHLDLLHPARSAFAACWPDVRLQTAEQRLCAVHRADDLPGAQAPLAFAEWLRRGDGAGLVRVMQHHRDDVLSLVALCAALCRAYRDPLPHGADEAGILRRLQRQGYRVRAGQGQLAFAP